MTYLRSKTTIDLMITIAKLSYANQRIEELKAAMKEAVEYDCLPRYTQERCIKALRGNESE